jgi:hypothetical protein
MNRDDLNAPSTVANRFLVGPEAGPLTIDYLLRANSPRHWSRQINGTPPAESATSAVGPLSGQPKRRRLRVVAGRVVRRIRPVVSPFAWRVRTFMLRPQYDIEIRLSAKIDASEARLSSRLGEVAALLRTTEKSATDALSEQRRLFVSLRNLIEVQSDEIARLKRQVSDSAARLPTGA